MPREVHAIRYPWTVLHNRPLCQCPLAIYVGGHRHGKLQNTVLSYHSEQGWHSGTDRNTRTAVTAYFPVSSYCFLKDKHTDSSNCLLSRYRLLLIKTHTHTNRSNCLIFQDMSCCSLHFNVVLHILCV